MTTPAPDLAAEVENIRGFDYWASAPGEYAPDDGDVANTAIEHVNTLLHHIEQLDKTIADFHLGEMIAVDSAVEIARLNARELEQPRPAAGVDEEVAEIYARMDVGNGLFSDLQRLRVALDRSAQECAGLREDLSHYKNCLKDQEQWARTEIGALKSQLREQTEARVALSKRLAEAIVGMPSEADLARLASYQACLTEVREEMPEVEQLRSLALPAHRQWWNKPEWNEIDPLFAAIDKLQSKEGANRNAIKLHLETIAARELANEHLREGMANLATKLVDAEARERGLRDRIYEALELVDQFETRTMTAWPTTKRINKILQSALAAQPAAAGRTPEQYAIEHGRYLATAAQIFMQECNAVIAADEALSEYWRKLENAIYQFTKRADRAYPLAQPAAVEQQENGND